MCALLLEQQLRELTEELEKKTTLIRSEKKEKEDLKAALAAETAEKELLKTTVATLQSEKDKLLAEAGQKEKDLVNQMAANGDTVQTNVMCFQLHITVSLTAFSQFVQQISQLLVGRTT